MSGLNKNPKYIEIAIDLCEQIKSRIIIEGMKLRGRSIASANYRVSSETMRKSLNLLQEYGVIHIKEKSGAVVHSREAAIKMLETLKKTYKIQSQFDVLDQLFQEKRTIDQQIQQSYKKMKQYGTSMTEKLPIEYFKVTLHPGYSLVGQKITNVPNILETNATLFGIIREGNPISNLQSNLELIVGDICFFSGSKEIADQTIPKIKMLT
jgi:DNA-binding transcriptional regulator YhcF (GntR family)